MAHRYRGERPSFPDVIANAVRAAVTVSRPRTRYVVGYMARPALFMRRWLSDRMFDRVIERVG